MLKEVEILPKSLLNAFFYGRDFDINGHMVIQMIQFYKNIDIDKKKLWKLTLKIKI